MTTLIAIYTGDGCIGRCDAKCYNAWGPECHCICQGGNHGAGKQEATASTRELPASWFEQAETAGQIISVPGPPAMHRSPANPQDGRHDYSRPPSALGQPPPGKTMIRSWPPCAPPATAATRPTVTSASCSPTPAS